MQEKAKSILDLSDITDISDFEFFNSDLIAVYSSRKSNIKRIGISAFG